LRDVSELSSSGGGAPLQLETLLTDSDDVPSSWITMSESTRTGLFPLYDTIICIPKNLTHHFADFILKKKKSPSVLVACSLPSTELPAMVVSARTQMNEGTGEIS
jgi:hypothetical protein